MENWDPLAPATRTADATPISGTAKIDVAGRSVNVSCSGAPEKGRPVIILMHGAGDGLDKPAAVQKTLSRRNRVCSYDRLGADASDQPDGPQDMAGDITKAIPEYGPRLEQAWSAGQRKWLALTRGSKLSTATNSGHYIYVDQPGVAVQAIDRVTARAARQAQGE